MTIGRTIRITAGFFGAFTTLVAIGSALRGRVGRIEILAAILGSGIALMAAAGPKAGKVYRTLAVVLLNTVVCFVVLELGSGALLSFLPWRPSASGPPEPDPPPEPPQISYYAVEPWGTRYWSELADVWSESWYFPHELLRRAPYSGELITVGAEGLRLTPGAVCEPGATKVWVFGGSTTWGYGVPDWGTIPAYLQAAWSQAVQQVCVVNFGQFAHTSTQGLIALGRELQRCNVPDIVISYDGVNDVWYSRQANLPGAHPDLHGVALRLEGKLKFPSWAQSLSTVRLLRRFVAAEPPPPPRYPVHSGPVAPGLAAGISEVYLNNVRLVRAWAREYGFHSFSFWQPMIWIGKKPLTEEERRESIRPQDEPLQDLFREVYTAIGRAALSDRGIFDLSDVFDTIPSLIYFDPTHLTHEGNRLVAERILKIVGVPAPQVDQPNRPPCGGAGGRVPNR
jgi:lysophospholipase L1-like esterase